MDRDKAQTKAWHSVNSIQLFTPHFLAVLYNPYQITRGCKISSSDVPQHLVGGLQAGHSDLNNNRVQMFTRTICFNIKRNWNHRSRSQTKRIIVHILTCKDLTHVLTRACQMFELNRTTVIQTCSQHMVQNKKRKHLSDRNHFNTVIRGSETRVECCSWLKTSSISLIDTHTHIFNLATQYVNRGTVLPSVKQAKLKP